MSFKYQRDKPLPKGLVHGITSIMFESALVPAEPPYKRDLFEQQGGRCNGCQAEFEYADFNVDHIIPVTKGGGRYIIDNLQLLCHRCNQLKGNGTQENLIARLRELEIVE